MVAKNASVKCFCLPRLITFVVVSYGGSYLIRVPIQITQDLMHWEGLGLKVGLPPQDPPLRPNALGVP